jgi:hypothetical protein
MIATHVFSPNGTLPLGSPRGAPPRRRHRKTGGPQRGATPAAQSDKNGEARMVSDAERFSSSFVDIPEGLGDDSEAFVCEPVLERQHAAIVSEIESFQGQVDALYASVFKGIKFPSEEADFLEIPADLSALTEASFGELGRRSPATVTALLAMKERTDPRGWLDFQSRVNALKLRRGRLEGEARDVLAAVGEAEKLVRDAAAPSEYDAVVARQCQSSESASSFSSLALPPFQRTAGVVNIVLITGFESFNVSLYKEASVQLARACPGVTLRVFSDRDLMGAGRSEVETALDGADVFFGSLLFDYDQVEWLRGKIENVPTRLVFESALELMGTTQVGSFRMAPGGKAAGPPPAVKKVLGMFGSGREEDRMVGYLSFLKGESGVKGVGCLGFLPRPDNTGGFPFFIR